MTGQRRAWPVWTVLIGVTVAICGLATTDRLVDPDAYWHIMIGRDIWTHHRFTGDPAWTFGPTVGHWVTTQWFAEVLMAGLYATFGWAGLTLLRLVCALATLAVLGRDVLRGPGAFWARTVVFTLVGLAVATDIVERPASITFVFLAAVGIWARQVLAHGRWPRPWLPVALTVVWANVHGSWVLMPAALAALVVLRVVAGTPLRQVRTPALVTVLCAVAGGLTPAGLYGYIAPLRVAAAAGGSIEEWQRTGFQTLAALTLFALAGFAALAWLRRRAPVVEVVWALVWGGFALLAYRNVVPALLLVAPLVAYHVSAEFTDRQTHAGSRLAVAVTVTLLAFGPVAGVVRAVATPRLPTWTPAAAYQVLRAEPGQRRLLVDYPAGGQALMLTDASVRVAIDGRTDRYGADYIHRYLGLMALAPGWQTTLAKLQPTDALIRADAPLRAALAERGWTTVVAGGRYVLLHSPEAPR